MKNRPLANVNRLLSASLALLLGAAVPGAHAAQPSPPFAADACGYVRGATGCTANDTNDMSITLDPLFAGSDPTSCNAGDNVTIHLKVTVGTTATERYNLGFLFSKDGKNPIVDPATTGASSCSAFTLPSPPFPELDTPPNSCGDQSSASSNSFTTGSITVKCVAGAGGKLLIPYVGLWNNQTAACSGVTDLVAGTSSKCTYNQQTVNVDVVTPTGSVQLVKSLVPANDPGKFNLSVTPSGGTAATVTDVGNAGSVTKSSIIAGTVVTLAESAGTGTSLGNYTSSLACVNSATGASVPVASNQLTMPDPPIGIVCTYTNTRKSATLQLKKQWSNAKVGDTASLTATGLVNSATVGFSSTVDTGNDLDAGTAVTVYAGEVATLSETVNPAANYTSTGPVCTGTSGLSGSTLTVGAADTTIVCTYTNTRKQGTLQVKKTWVNAHVGDTASIGVTGIVNAASAGLNSTANTANETDPGSVVTMYAGETANFSESVNPSANYTSNFSCVASAGAAFGAAFAKSVGDTYTMPSTPVDVVCTYTNTRKSATLQLKKQWSNAKVGDTASLTATGLVNSATVGFTSTADTASDLDAGTAVTVYAGEVATLGETVNPAANYSSSGPSCTGTSGLSGSTLTVGAADTAIVCTYTNTRVSRNLTLKKTWVNGKSGDQVTVTTTGLTNNATITSTSSGSNTDTGSAVSNVPGATVTLPAETFNTGSQSNYTTTVACTGATPSGSSPGATFTMPDNDVTCTYTNTRVSRSLTLKKTWVNGKSGDQVTATTTGLANNATITSTSSGNNTDTGSAVSNVPGGTVTLPAETFNTGSQSNYTTTVACTGATPSGSSPGATFTMPDNDVTCTYTNTRVSRSLTLKKSWVNGINGDQVTATTTGLANNATVTSTSSGSNTDTGSAVSNVPGGTVTLPAETFNTGSQSNYTTTVACTGATPSGSSPGATFTMPDNDVTCTYTNARNARTLTLKKTWVNAKNGDSVTVTTTGLANNATVSSTADGTGNNTTTGSPASNVPGATVTLPAETFNTGSQSNYTTTVACTGATPSGSSPGATFTMPDNDVTCTYTNARVSRSLTLKKTWVNGKSGDQVTVTTTGLASNATITSTSSGNNTDTGSSVANAPGATVTLPAETFNTGSQSNYTTTVACTGVTPSGSSPGATFAMPDNDVTCTYTNTRKSATLQLRKTWVNARIGDAVTVTATGIVNSAGATLNAVAGANNETDDGSAVTVFAGEQATLAEGAITGSGDTYLQSFSCSGNANALAGSVLTVSDGDTAIVCTFVNEWLPPAPPPPTKATAIPASSSETLAMMAALLALLGAIAMRRRGGARGRG